MARSTPGEKDLQPERLEQGHADNILAFVANCDVIEKDSFEFETKSAVQVNGVVVSPS